MTAQNAGAPHAKEIAPLSIQCVQHERTEPHAGGLRHPHAFVFRNGSSYNLLGRERVSGLHKTLFKL